MKHLISVLALVAMAFAGAAHAADPAASAPKANTAQQEKMKSCNASAGELKGDERKAHMKKCLSASATPAQQEKMKTCNKDAGDKKGDERKAFMKTCLSNKPA